MTRRVIHSRGRNDWQLAVCGSDVTASIHNLATGSVLYSTADFGLRYYDDGADGLTDREVVERYSRAAQTDESVPTLLERVNEAIDNPTDDTPEAISA